MKKNIAVLLFLSARWSCLLLLHKRRVRKKRTNTGKAIDKKTGSSDGRTPLGIHSAYSKTSQYSAVIKLHNILDTTGGVLYDF